MYGEAVLAENRGHEVHIFAPADAWSGQDAGLYRGMTVHTAPAFGPARFRFAPRLTRALIAADLDVLHVQGIWQPHGLSALSWHQATGRPLAVSPHGMIEPWILARSRKAKRAVSALFQDRLMIRAAALHALTEQERDQAAALFPSRRERIAVIPNYVATVPPSVAGKPDWWRSKMEGRRIFLFFGRLHSKKGIDELLSAWEGLSGESAQARDGAQLVFCGWIDDLKGFEERVAALDETFGNVVYGGPQFGDDKWRSFAAATMMVLPSKSEGLPMAILEAWSAGLPTLMTAQCNLPEGFANGAAIACGHEEADILGALRDCEAMSAEALAQMGENARRLVAERFSQKQFAAALLALYSEMLQCGDGRAGADAIMPVSEGMVM